MKKLILGCICLLATVATSQVQATVVGIEVLSQEYHIGGVIDRLNGGLSGYEYDITDNSPISRMITYEVPDPAYGSGHIWAHSSTELFYAEVDTLGYDDGRGTVYPADAYADAIWTFRPLTSDLKMQVDGYGALHGAAWWSLTDHTTGVEVVNQFFFGGSEEEPLWDNFKGWYDYYNFDPTHQYTVEVQMRIGGDWGEGYNGSWSATITPEPVTICLLGLGGLALLKKRRA